MKKTTPCSFAKRRGFPKHRTNWWRKNISPPPPTILSTTSTLPSVRKKVFASQAVLGRMQLTLHASHPAPPVSLRAWCKQSMPAWSVKDRRALSRHCGGARVYGVTTRAVHDLSTPPYPPSTSSISSRKINDSPSVALPGTTACGTQRRVYVNLSESTSMHVYEVIVSGKTAMQVAISRDTGLLQERSGPERDRLPLF